MQALSDNPRRFPAGRGHYRWVTLDLRERVPARRVTEIGGTDRPGASGERGVDRDRGELGVDRVAAVAVHLDLLHEGWAVGSCGAADNVWPSLARVAEWQTQRTQNPPIERSCGFESHLGHQAGSVWPPMSGSTSVWSRP